MRARPGGALRGELKERLGAVLPGRAGALEFRVGTQRAWPRPASPAGAANGRIMDVRGYTLKLLLKGAEAAAYLCAEPATAPCEPAAAP
jgi:hypothetical protein